MTSQSLEPKTTSLSEEAERYSRACNEYRNEDERERLKADWERKGEMAEGVLADFTKRVYTPNQKDILEVGFGNGVQLCAFAKAGARVYGVEVNELLCEIAEKEFATQGLQADLRVYDGYTLPYGDAKFDAGYAISVLEHVDDQERVLHEVHRVLKPGGKFYLAFPNRWYPLETHTKLFFLSYLPRNLARFLLEARGKKTITDLNLHFIGPLRLRALIKKTGFVLCYETEKGTPFRKFLKAMLAWAGLHHSALLPHLMVVLEKPAG